MRNIKTSIHLLGDNSNKRMCLLYFSYVIKYLFADAKSFVQIYSPRLYNFTLVIVFSTNDNFMPRYVYKQISLAEIFST